MLSIFNIIFSFVPPHIKTRLQDYVVNKVADAFPEQRSHILAFRSDAEFRIAFDKALDRAVQRFTEQYEDKDIVHALTRDTHFWDIPSVQNALQEIFTRPSSYLKSEQYIVHRSFADVLPKADPERVQRAVNFFLRCLFNEVINIPQLAQLYPVHFQQLLVEQGKQQLVLQEVSLNQNLVIVETLREISTHLKALNPNQLLLTSSIDQLPALPTPKLQHNLPPRYGEFLGRKDYIERVLKGMKSRWPLISIEGMGGMGKTTLATKVAYICLSGPEAQLEPPFETVVWVSAQYRPEQKYWLNEVLDTTIRVLGETNLMQLPLEQKKGEVDNLLRNHRTLVIVDNFETIEDEDLLNWIPNIPEPSKILVTTRYAQLRMAWSIHLLGLEKLESLELMRNHASRLELQAIEQASEEALVPLFEVTDGNPKVIEMALGFIREGSFTLEEVVEHLYEATEKVNNIFDYLFAKAWEIMGSDAKQVFLVLPFFESSASKQALEATSGLKGYQLDKALNQLVELSLLDVNTKTLTSAHRYSIHPLTRSFASAKLGELENEVEKQARARWVDYYKGFASRILVREKPGGKYWNTLVSHGLTHIDPEWHNFRKVLAWADQQGQDRTLVELMLLLIHYMDRRLLYTERLMYARKAAEAAGRLGWKEVEALFYIDALGWTFMEQGNFPEAKQEIMKAQEIIEAIETENAEVADVRTLATTFLARVHLEQGDISEAAACIDKAMCSECSPVIRSRVYVIAGDIADSRGVYSEAIKHYNNACAASQEYSEADEEFEAYYRLGLVHLKTGDLESAEAQFKKIIEIEKEGVTIELIFAKFGLATSAIMKGEKDEARMLAEESFQELFRLAPSHKLLSVIQNLLSSFEEVV